MDARTCMHNNLDSTKAWLRIEKADDATKDAELYKMPYFNNNYCVEKKVMPASGLMLCTAFLLSILRY